MTTLSNSERRLLRDTCAILGGYADTCSPRKCRLDNPCPHGICKSLENNILNVIRATCIPLSIIAGLTDGTMTVVLTNLPNTSSSIPGNRP